MPPRAPRALPPWGPRPRLIPAVVVAALALGQTGCLTTYQVNGRATKRGIAIGLAVNAAVAAAIGGLVYASDDEPRSVPSGAGIGLLLSFGLDVSLATAIMMATDDD